MSNAKHETIADIVAEMRKDIAEGTVGIWSDFGGEIARSYADRIEAAAKREREAGADAAQVCGEIGEMIGREAACKEKVTDCNHLGNAAKMREARKVRKEKLKARRGADGHESRKRCGRRR